MKSDHARLPSRLKALVPVLAILLVPWAAAQAQNPMPPTGVTASDGTYADYVHITWEPDTNGPPLADGFRVYRHTSPSSGLASVVGDWVFDTSYDDTTAVPETVYFYWVKSFAWDGGSSQYLYSAFSSSDSGYAHVSGPTAYYVNNTTTVGDIYTTSPGHDANNGLTPGTPKAGVQAILDTYDIEPGDTIYVDTGTYTLTSNIVVSALDAGSAANWVTIQGSTNVPAGGTVIDRNGTGAGTAALSIGSGSGYVRLRDLTTFQGRSGISLAGCSNVLLERVELYGAAQYGAEVKVAYADFRGCRIHDNGLGTNGAGIVVSTGAVGTITHCTLWSNGQYGVKSETGTIRMSNTVVAAAGGGRRCIGGNGVSYSGDYNNLFHGGGARVYGDASTERDLFAWQAASGQDLRSLSHDPLFGGDVAADVHLKSVTGRFSPTSQAFVVDSVHSPCIDTGNPAWPYASETVPNGSRVNIGAYGNTTQASKSRTNAWLLALTLNDGGVANPTSILRWVCGPLATGHVVSVDHSVDGGGNWLSIASGVTASAESYVWNCSGAASTTQALWRVVSEANPDVSDVIDNCFIISNAVAGPVAPANLAASDGWYSDRIDISWDAVGGVDGYALYRATNSATGAAVLRADGLGTTSYSDTTVVAGVTYWYWAKSYEFDGTGRTFSAFSASNSGYAVAGPSITCESYNSGEIASGVVTLRWSTANMVTSGTVRIDFSPNAGVIWTQLAAAGSGAGAYAWNSASVGDTTLALWRVTALWDSNLWDVVDRTFSVDNINPPNAPTGLAAGDGAHADRVALSWNLVTNALSYRVYRNTSNNSASAGLILSPAGTSANDTSAVPAVVYYYWVKSAASGGGTNLVYSDFSAPDTGYRYDPIVPGQPTGLSATDGDFANKVQLTWTGGTNSDQYGVYRSTTNFSGGAGQLNNWFGSSSFADTSAVPGTVYYYWVRGRRFDGLTSNYVNGPLSASDSGYANIAPVAAISASPTNGIAPLRVTLDYSDSYDPIGEIVLCEIDKEGDGSYDFSSDGPGDVVVEYTSAGTYQPAVRVTDDKGLQDTGTAVVVVWGDSPTAVFTATPTSGTAALSVSFNGSGSYAAAGRTIVIYEFDVDGDGVYDRLSTNGLGGWTYGAAGTYDAALRVTDNRGLQDVDTERIVVSAPADPPVATLSASTATGTIPFAVVFTADVTGGGTVTNYQWDWDGDGSYDSYSTTNRKIHIYTAVGTYPATVRVVDNAGLSDTDSETIYAAAPQALRVWMVTPCDGETVWGNRVTVRANTAPASRTMGLRFQYREAGAPTWSNLSAWIYPPPSSFATNWDVTSLTETQHEVRAVAMDISSNLVYSDSITVSVDSGGGTNVGDTVEETVGGFQQRRQIIDAAALQLMGISDGTFVMVPAGTVGSNMALTVVLTGLNTNPPSGSAAGRASIGENRHVTLGDTATLMRPIVLIVPYDDVDQDGIVDGTGVPERTLSIHWYDRAAGQWRRALNVQVFAELNYVRGVTYHLTEFGVFGSKNLLHPSNGSTLDGFTSEESTTNAAANLTDDNTISFWGSEPDPDGPQQMTYSFKDDQSAIVSGATLYNSGTAEGGYSLGFALYGSINETDYTLWTNGVLATNTDAQFFDFGSITCRSVRLVITNGVSASSWQLAEFELYGDLTPDADNDDLEDAWEVGYFGDLHSNSRTNDPDEDGVPNGDEQGTGTSPIDDDSDDDGMTDGDEVTAGTSGTNRFEYFCIGTLDAESDGGGGNLLQNEGFETGWIPQNTVAYWTYNNPAGFRGGGAWGDVDLDNRQAHSGSNSASIRNESGADLTGGWWQQVPGAYAVGTVWEAAAWVWSDALYTNNRCELKLEFMDVNTNWIPGGTVFHYFTAPGEAWTRVSGVATSIPGTEFVRFVLVGADQGTSGALLFDDCYLAPVSSNKWIINWQSTTGRVYKVYSTDDLGDWKDKVFEGAGTGGVMGYTNRALGDALGFMRVTVERE